jgi:hypothetical protein
VRVRPRKTRDHAAQRHGVNGVREDKRSVEIEMPLAAKVALIVRYKERGKLGFLW